MWRSTAARLELPITCDGKTHRLIWNQGSIDVVDHPELDAELAMVAFGGAEPACLTQLKLWEEAIADGGFLAEWVEDAALTPAWFSWLSMALERMRTEGFHEVLRSLHPARSMRMGQFLEQFPLEWMDRAAAQVAEADLEGDGVICTDATGHIVDAVGVRLRRAFVNSVGGRHVTIGAAALVPLTITVDPDAAPAASGALSGRERGLTLTVAPSWLHRVWAADAHIIDGYLIVDLTPTAPRAALATRVDWQTRDGVAYAMVGTTPVVHTDQGWGFA